MRTISQSSLAQADRDVVRAAVEALRRQFPVDEVVLFGSRARGDASTDSDFDLLVLTSRRLSHPERLTITAALSPLGRELGVVFNTVVVGSSDWNTGPYRLSPLRDEVMRDGLAA